MSRIFAVLIFITLSRATTLLFRSSGVFHRKGLSPIELSQTLTVMSKTVIDLKVLTLSRTCNLFSARLILGSREVSLGFKGVRSS